MVVAVKFGNRWCFACHKKAHDTWLVVITCCHRIDGLRGESNLSCSQNLGCNHKRRSAEKNRRKMLAHRWIHREWLRGGVLWYGSAKVKRRNLSLCSRMITLQLINLPQVVASDKGQEFDILINCHNSRSPCPTLNGRHVCMMGEMWLSNQHRCPCLCNVLLRVLWLLGVYCVPLCFTRRCCIK